ncbi:MFS transporter [Aphanothece hegewaldii CCALA 016]|uniref:MFS transporter n=1 Tax=Aphanothece hegewaldii CCALA 016 TaxID=2107694 RepID=A0A2T1LSI8_9CHRO|nr:MFS transporter [Aphanothece hegewaldii]PSF32480.1 MFS transporter [Aphanothece hegewaldii CCALA 016]
MKALKIFKTIDSKSLQNLLILFATGLLFWISITNLLPTLPAYIEDLGGSKQEIGLVMGSFAIGLLASRVWLGKLADRRSRKLVILIGTIVAGIAPFGYLLIKSVYPLISVRAFHGVAIAAFTTGYSALVVDLSPIKQRGEIIGYMSLVVPVGMAIGPALGSFIEEDLGYQALFLFSATAGLLSFILANCITAGRPPVISEQEKSQFEGINRSLKAILFDRAILVPTLILFLIGLLFGVLVTFLPLYLRQSQIDFSAGLFYTTAAIASFTSRILSGRAGDRFGRGIFITFSIICYGLSMLLLSIAKNPTMLMLSAILEGAGGGIIIPMILALISDRSYAMERGRVFAICTSGFDVGGALAAPILGAFAIEYEELFMIAGSFAAIALVIFLGYSNKGLISSLRYAIGREKDQYSLVD